MSSDERSQRFLYPIKSNLDFVDEAAITQHLELVFSGVQWAEGKYVCLRGVGERDTPKEGQFRDDIFIQPHVENLASRAIEICRRWAQYHVAAFVVPCVLREPRGKSENVSFFSNILCDLDSGDTTKKLSWLYEAVGEPTMVVASGGTTDAGTPKRHVYYCLEDPTDQIAAIVKLRDMIARKVGADPTMGLGVDSNPFGRSHQPVRIAGTCHAKGGIAKPCYFEHRGPRIALARVIEGVERMTFAPWVDAEMASRSAAKIKQVAQGGVFSPQSGQLGGSELLNKDVYEGSEDPDRNRWTSFNRAAGYHIRRARQEECSLAEAESAVFDWVTARMFPAWPDHRVHSEFHALLARDSAVNGPMPSERPNIPLKGPEPLAVVLGVPEWQKPPPIPEPKSLMECWAAHRWAVEPRPSHQFLVDKLIIKGEPHLFVAEGGSGKTFQVIDLAMKVAAWVPGDDYAWCGQKIRQGGTVVLILCEESKTETHIRLLDIEGGKGMIHAAGDKLVVLPMTSLGGAFPLVARESKSGVTTSSPKWNQLIGELAKIPDLAMVAIDTFNSVAHGDENSANIIAEMMREAHRVCGELGASLIFNHHIRKGEAIKSLKELADSVRGSTAITSYFRVVMGMFHAEDYRRRMQAMNLRAEKLALWRFGIAKCNINGLMRGERTLLRNHAGLLGDVTAKDKFNMANMAEREAWLIFAIKRAAEAGHPYGTGGKNAKSGLFMRRSELPPILRKMGEYEFRLLTEDALQGEKITQCAIKGSKMKAYFDVTEGPLATDSFGGEVNAGAYAPGIEWDEWGYSTIEEAILMKRDIRTPFAIGPAVTVS